MSKSIYVSAAVVVILAGWAGASGATPFDVDIPVGAAYKIGGQPVLLTGAPLIHGGTSGVVPTIGTDNTSGIEVRAAAGETFSAWLGNDWTFFVESQAAFTIFNINGEALADGYISAPAPLFTASGALNRSMSTARADATLGDITIELPCIEESIGRRYTVKKTDLTKNAVVIRSPRSGCGSPAPIDGVSTQQITAPWGFLTVEGFGAYGGGAGWLVVAR
ncbi:MAG TPA: hypothetical protein VK459_09000 [Polyangiaceae bacterium]|nr:hypothetical protein [Polyangiaceae bacterium]